MLNKIRLVNDYYCNDYVTGKRKVIKKGTKGKIVGKQMQNINLDKNNMVPLYECLIDGEIRFLWNENFERVLF